jgi:dihydrodipicolinate reductase
MIEQYKKFNNFKKDVLERAKNEINEKTDLLIDYQEIKEARKITAISFTIRTNPNFGKTDFEKNQSAKLENLSKEYRSELALIESLVEYGFSKIISKRLLKNSGETVVADALKAVNLQIERGNVKNPKAMLQTAIKEQWHPEKFKQK